MGAGTSLSLLPDKGTGLSVYPYSLRGEWVGPKLAGGGGGGGGEGVCREMGAGQDFLQRAFQPEARGTWTEEEALCPEMRIWQFLVEKA